MVPRSLWKPAGLLFAPFLLLLLIACGSPAAPDPAVPPAGDPSQPPAVGDTPQATPAPVTEATPAPAPPSASQPTGTLNVGAVELGRFMGHPSLIRNPALFVASTIPVGEGLMTADRDTNPIPLIAESWSVSEDFTTWTFPLRKGIQFHKGYGEMTAEDVVWSFEQWNLNDTHARVANSREFWAAEGGSIETPDDYTVVVNTGNPIPDLSLYEFMMIPSGSPTWVVSKRQTEEIGVEAADQDIAATGPWEIVEARTAEFWRLQAVEDHWRQTPYFAELILREIPEESARLAGFQTGQLDTFDMSFDSIPLVESVSGAKLMQVPNAGTSALNFYGQYYVGVGTPEQRAGYDPDLPWVAANPDVNSVEWARARMVREALSIAIDRQALADTVLGGFARPGLLRGWDGPGETLLPPEMRSWEFNPERARELLIEAGYADGFRIDHATSIRGAPAEVEACEAIATMWQDIGVDARIQRIPYETLRPTLVARTRQGSTCHAVRIRLAPVQEVISHTTTGSFSNGVEHPWLEEKIGEMRRAIDPAQRQALEAEVGRFYYENALTTVGLYVYDTVWPVGPRIDVWDDHVKHWDIRQMNGFEYIPHRE